MSLQDEVVQEIFEKRSGWAAEIEKLRKEISNFQKKIDEADAVLARLIPTSVPPEPPHRPPPEPISLEPPPRRPAEPPPPAPPPPASTGEIRGKGGQAPSRAGIPLENWLSVIRREFRDRDFTTLELVSAMPGLDPNKDSHRQAGREVLRRLPEVEQVTTGRDQRFKLKSTIQISGPGALADAQAAWDRENGENGEGTRESVPRGMPVPGTGRHSPYQTTLNGIPRDLVKLIQPALEEGWVPSTTRKNKVKVTHPEQPSRFFTVPTTPSDVRTAANLRAEMRGVNAPGV